MGSSEERPAPTKPAAPRGSTGGRASLVTIDQGLSSVTNLVAVIWVAHAVPAAEFGLFSLLMMTYTFVMGPIHAVVSMRVVVHPDDADHRPRQVLANALALGLLGAAPCVVLGLVQVLLGWTIGPAMLALGLALPLLVLHDVGRWVGIAQSAPARAVVLDASWLVLLVVGLASLEVLDEARLFTVVLVWVGTGALAATVVLFQQGMLRAADISFGWVRERWDQSWRLLVGNMVGAGSALVGATLVALVSTPLAVAAVHAALLLGRPTTAVQMAIASSTAADIARERPGRRGLLRHQRRTMALCSVVAVLNLVVLALLPDPVGAALLGNVWPVIAPLMVVVALRLVLTAAQGGVPAVLIGRHQFHAAMIVQIIGGVWSMAALVAGALMAGPEGAVWALVIGQAGMAAAWWTGLVRYLGRSGADRDVD